MTPDELMEVEKNFRKAAHELEEGTASAVFLVVVSKDDSADTYFAGQDGEQVPAGLCALSTIHEWLVNNGMMASRAEMLMMGKQLRREPGNGGDDEKG